MYAGFIHLSGSHTFLSKLYLWHTEESPSDLEVHSDYVLELTGKDVHGCTCGIPRDQWLREERGDEAKLEDPHHKL